jgi:hypothetical protein
MMKHPCYELSVNAQLKYGNMNEQSVITLIISNYDTRYVGKRAGIFNKTYLAGRPVG